MNCANHPETPAVSYCQYCGKPLCAECVHKVNNVISCEPCLAARVQAAGTGGYGPRSYGAPADPSAPHADYDVHPWGTEPWLAFALGFIPGVGAIYNGQVAKGLAHVVIFAVLADLAHYNGAIGIIVAAWVFYQAFDAYQTALARRNDLPLPNPLGLNDVGRWFGARSAGPYTGVHPGNVPPANAVPIPPAAPPQGMPGHAPASGFAAGFAPPYVPPRYTGPPYGAPVPPMPPIPPNPRNATGFWGCCGGVPTGAIILIVLGVLFLLGNFGVLSENWFDRGWPILLIILGLVAVIRHTQNPPAGGVR